MLPRLVTDAAGLMACLPPLVMFLHASCFFQFGAHVLRLMLSLIPTLCILRQNVRCQSAVTHAPAQRGMASLELAAEHAKAQAANHTAQCARRRMDHVQYTCMATQHGDTA